MSLHTHTLIDNGLSGSIIYQDENSCHVELTTTENMQVDESGLVHGGFIFSAADYAAMGAINHPYVVLGSAEVRFMKPTRTGEVLIFIAGIESIDGKKTKVKVTGTNESQEKIFEGTFTCFTPEKHILS